MSGGKRPLKSRKREEASRLVGHVAKVGQAATQANDVEQVAMVAGSGVGPFAGGALPGFSALQPDEERAAGRVANVADHPIATLAATVREIAAAHRLGVARETARQVRRLLRHDGVLKRKEPAVAGGLSRERMLLPWLFSRDRVGVGRDRSHLPPVARPRPWPISPPYERRFFAGRFIDG